VFVRSPAAYEALKSFDILQLPSPSTLQSYTGAFLHEAGAASESIAKQVEMYEASILKCKKKESWSHSQMECSYLMRSRWLVA